MEASETKGPPWRRATISTNPETGETELVGDEALVAKLSKMLEAEAKEGAAVPVDAGGTLPTYAKGKLPAPPETWPRYRKVSLTRALRIEGAFRVVTTESENEPFLCHDGYLAIDSRGYPYAIAKEEFEAIYASQDDLRDGIRRSELEDALESVELGIRTTSTHAPAHEMLIETRDWLRGLLQ